MDRSDLLSWEKHPDPAYGCIKFHYIYHDYPIYHGHDFYEFFICVGGSYHQNINLKTVVLKKLDACLTSYTAHHSIHEDIPDSSHYGIMIRKEDFESFIDFIDPSFLEELNKLDYQVCSFSEARMKKVISYLNQIKEIDGDPLKQGAVTKLLLFNLLEPIMAQNQLLKEEKRPQWLNNLIVEINSPNNLSWNVSDVVAHSNYSKTHLARLFKEEMGISIGEYLQEIKIQNARDILVNSDVSLAELCDIIGHSSLSHFSNVFKKRYGIAPGKYRTAHRQKE